MNTVRTRYIGLHHVAFFRSFFEGSLDIRRMAERYLETGSDIAAARETLKMIQDAFVAAALKIGKDKEAPWLVLPESTYRGKSDVDVRNDLALSEMSLPQVEDFDSWKERTDPDGVMGENELVEMYECEFADELREIEKAKAGHAFLPPASAVSASDLAKRVSLINELSLEVVAAPRLSDAVAGWFAPTVSRNLQKAKIYTLADIVAKANEHGFRWYKAIPKLGEKTAEHILSWLSENNPQLDDALRPTALRPVRKLSKDVLVQPTHRYGITTLETLAVPHPLSGVDGTNRAELSRNKLDAKNDYDAIHAWLNLRKVAHTFLSYRKEAERLLLWAVCVKRKPFSSLNTNDMAEYLDFLREPPEDWCSDRRYERYHEKWRPFVIDPKRKVGEPFLSEVTIAQARSITSSLFEWLVGQRYLDSNPVLGLPDVARNTAIKVDHSFNKAQWKHVVRCINDMPLETVEQHRIRFLILYAYGTGLRRVEIAQSVIGNLKPAEFDGNDLEDVYMLSIVGKGNKLRTIPVPRLVITALQDYLEARGLSRRISSNPPDTPLISSLHGPSEPVTTKTVYLLVKNFFAHVAATLSEDSEAYSRFKRASTHWLRHTYGSHGASNGMRLPTIQENMGHSSLTTTSIYVKTEDEQRWRETQSFMETGFQA